MYIKVLIASVLSIVAIGCSSFQDNSTPLIILITPTDGATNVEREVNIRVTFDESMDISTCESRFGFLKGQLLKYLRIWLTIYQVNSPGIPIIVK